MPKVYSPAGVSGWLRNCCAAQDDEAIPASAALQSHQIVLLDIIAVRIRALAIQMEVGRTVDAAEGRFFPRLPVDDNDDRVAGNCAALMARPVYEAPENRATPDAHPPARHHGTRQGVERSE